MLNMMITQNFLAFYTHMTGVVICVHNNNIYVINDEVIRNDSFSTHIIPVLLTA